MKKKKYFINLFLLLFSITSGYFFFNGIDSNNLGDLITIEYIEMYHLPTKTTYQEGEIFDNKGLVIKAVGLYDDEYYATEINDYKYNTNPLTKNDKEIKITYKGFDCVVPINIVEKYKEVKLESYKFDSNFLYLDKTQDEEYLETTLSNESGLEVFIDNYNENNIVGTGSRVTFYEGERLNTILSVVIKGDVNGDGTVSISDVSMLNSYLQNNLFSKKNYYFKSSDINEDGKINSNDLKLLLEMVMGE